MTAKDSKSHLPYLNKLVNQYNNTYHHSIGKRIVSADYSALTENIDTNPKALKFKVNDRINPILHRVFFIILPCQNFYFNIEKLRQAFDLLQFSTEPNLVLKVF